MASTQRAACQECRRLKKACDRRRPCGRCIDRGMQATCTDATSAAQAAAAAQAQAAASIQAQAAATAQAQAAAARQAQEAAARQAQAQADADRAAQAEAARQAEAEAARQAEVEAARQAEVEAARQAREGRLAELIDQLRQLWAPHYEQLSMQVNCATDWTPVVVTHMLNDRATHNLEAKIAILGAVFNEHQAWATAAITRVRTMRESVSMTWVPENLDLAEQAAVLEHWADQAREDLVKLAAVKAALEQVQAENEA